MSSISRWGNDPAEQVLQGVFDRDVGSSKAGTRDCGIVFAGHLPTHP